ncbi:hypothetical protein IU487_33025 [Nocardia puris]|uniref:hypothetical protein n=1 Tax=Nocardia puris TaxID=208602 RepID=UPI001895898A|nr:hypothetical protein [Nocardia puris]MBF6215824.1 hypothetical protein [Nocardia puris]
MQTGRRRDDRSPIQQFTLAAIARTALAESMTYRDGPVTDKQLWSLCSLAIKVDQPDIAERGVTDNLVMRRLLARISYQQYLHGYAELEDIVRTLALFVEHDPAVTGMPTAAEWEAVLGVPLPNYLALAFAVFVRTGVTGGCFTADDFVEHAALGALGGVGAATARAVLDAHLAEDVTALAARATAGETKLKTIDHRLWLSNPLLARPLIRKGDGYLAPINPYVIDKVTPLGMYFTGLEHFGGDFPELVGRSFEKLVGRHLQLLEPVGAQIFPEIRYGHEGKLTCDYIVVLPGLVLLVEAKGLRSIEDARLGHENGLRKLAERVQHARNQIATTASLIRDRISELAHIPADYPVRGLVVTLEPIHLIDTVFFADLLEPTDVPTATTSAHDFEQVLATLLPLPDAAARILEALTAKPPYHPPSFPRAVEGLPRERNPIATRLWDDWMAAVLPTNARTPERRSAR